MAVWILGLRMHRHETVERNLSLILISLALLRVLACKHGNANKVNHNTKCKIRILTLGIPIPNSIVPR